MKVIEDINNLSIENYYSLWAEFWFNKLGYYPVGIQKIGCKKTFEEAERDDDILEKELLEFYNNKRNK